MENALRACCKGIKIGKILIHREGDDGKQLIYHNLPKDIAKRHVLLLDPILGTGNSAVQAISLLLEKRVQEANIIFLNLISVCLLKSGVSFFPLFEYIRHLEFFYTLHKQLGLYRC